MKSQRLYDILSPRYKKGQYVSIICLCQNLGFNVGAGKLWTVVHLCSCIGLHADVHPCSCTWYWTRVHLCGCRGCRQMCTFITTLGFRQMCISAVAPVQGQMSSVSTPSVDRCASLQLQWVADRCAPLHRAVSLNHREHELKIIWRKAKIIRNLSHLTGEKEFKELAVLLKGMLCRYPFFGFSLMTWKKETKKIMNIPRMESVQELPNVQKSD